MKARKGKKTKQKSKNRNFVGNTGMIIPIVNNPILKSQKIHLVATVKTTLPATTAADRVCFVNDAYNPFGGLDARQGYWFDQFAAMYQKMMVEKCTISVWAGSPSGSGSHSCVGFVSTNITTVTTAPDVTAARPDAQVIVTYATAAQPTVFKWVVPTRKFIAYKDWADSDSLSSTTAADGLADFIYFHLSQDNTNAAAQVMWIKMEQDVIFYSPVTQAAS